MTSAPTSSLSSSRREAPASARREEFIRAHYRFQQGRFFTAVELDKGGVHAASDLPVPMWNHSAWFGGEAADFGAFLRDAEMWHQEHERRPVVYVLESDDRGALLEEAGYEYFDRETWMARAVAAAEEKGTSAFSIAPVSDLTEFTQIFKAGFNAASSQYYGALRRDPADHEADQIHLLARLDGEPVAIGTVVFEGELACIYNVSTAPKFRGKGAGAAVMEAAMQAARKRGCRWAFLQVESGSGAERLYTKLGFEPLFRRVGFRKTEWTDPAAIHEESALSKALGFSGRISSSRATEAHETRAVQPEVTAALQKFCRAEGLNEESVITGAWAILLSRYLNTHDVVFQIARREGGVQTIQKTVTPDTEILQWLREGEKSVNESDVVAETTVNLGSRQRGLAGSVALSADASLSGLDLAYRSELFSKDSIRRMANHFVTLLEGFAKNPNRKLRELEMLTGAERDQLLKAWSSGGAIEWRGETILDLIETQAKRAPKATALILAENSDLDKTPRLSFEEMMRAAGERACALVHAGVTSGAAVGVLLPRSLDAATSIFAIWRAGAVFVPLDSSYPPERIAFMALDSGMKAVITCKSLAPLLPATLTKIFVDDTERRQSAPTATIKPEDPAYVIYTSGSTGQPKGVTITHAAIAQHVAAMARYYEITPQDRHLHFSPFTFDASFEQLLPPLVAGASVVIRDERLWDVGEFIENIAKLGLTMADLPMAYWHQLCQHSMGMPAETVPDNFRIIIAGGEAMASDRLALWQQGPFATRRLVNAYGPTEATVTATAFEAADFKGAAASSVPIGRPLPGRTAYILDESLQPAPIRVVGQLYLGGALLASGYLNRPELTSERFIKNPFESGKLYCTGDMARYLEDGTIEFLGRADDQIKIRGFRVEPGEIEAALQEHAAIREAVVVAREDSAAQKRLIAYVTQHDAAASERELRQWLRGRLPEYMTPAAIITLKKFPLLPSGKVNRKALPDPAIDSVAAPSAGPKTPLELQLQLLFQRVLRRGGVGVDENFFELGGDSLQALELIVQIEKSTGRRLPLETLFQTPTVQRLATELQRVASGDDWSCLVTLQKSGTRPPIFLVHTTPGDVLGYGNLLHHLGPDQPCYGFQALGLKEGAQPETTIEGMAARYVALLKEFQPKGPYLLGGWCFGGIVAVEMAQQLRAAGDEIAALMLMETIAVPPGPGNFKYHSARLKCLFAMSPDRWRAYLRAKAKYRRQVENDNRMRFRQAGEDVDPEQRRWLARLEQVYNANLAALDSYRSSYYPGKVILFNATEKDPGILPDPNYGWTGLADDIEIHEVAGNHDTMLAEPNVSSLAGAIRKVLS